MKKLIGDIIKILLVLILLVNSIFTFINSRNLYGVQKVCIANKCSEWVSGNAWATTYCKPNENKTDLICEFNYNNQVIKMPLSMLNTSQLSSCVNQECSAEVFVIGKKIKEVRRT